MPRPWFVQQPHSPGRFRAALSRQQEVEALERRLHEFQSLPDFCTLRVL